MQAWRGRFQEEFAASLQKGEIDHACHTWCAALAENAELRHFNSDAFVPESVDLVRNIFLQITNDRLKARTALWICSGEALVIGVGGRAGIGKCSEW